MPVLRLTTDVHLKGEPSEEQMLEAAEAMEIYAAGMIAAQVFDGEVEKANGRPSHVHYGNSPCRACRRMSGDEIE